MLQTFFYIPERIGGMPVFGVGLLLALWAVGSAILLGWFFWREGLSSKEAWGYVPLLALLGGLIWLVLPTISEPGLGLPIRGYGVMLLLGVVAGAALAAWRGARAGIDPNLIVNLVFWGFVPGLIGARLFYVIEYWHDFQKPTVLATLGEILRINQGGLVVYGSFFGGMLGFIAYLWKYKLPALTMFDLIAPGMLLGVTLGRIGCFLNGCCYGSECDLPWAVRFPAGSPPHIDQVEKGQAFLYGMRFQDQPEDPPRIAEVEAGSAAAGERLAAGMEISAVNGRPVFTVHDVRRALLTAARQGSELRVATRTSARMFRWSIAGVVLHSEPVHPTQLYSSIDALVICLFLLAIEPFCHCRGMLLALMMTIYPIDRFLMEMIRTDEPGILGTGLTIGQIVSLMIFLSAALLWGYLWIKRPGKGLIHPAPAT